MSQSLSYYYYFSTGTGRGNGRGNNAFFYALGAVVVAVVLGILLRYNGE